MVPIDISTFSKSVYFKGVSGKLISKLLMKILKLEKINNEYSKIYDKKGLEFVSAAIERINIKYEIDENDLKKIPKNGSFITISNHPFGGVDGLILLELIGKQRPDFKIFANFILSRFKTIEDFFIPVDPFENKNSEKSNYPGIRKALKHIKNGGPLGVFPAGEVSTYQPEYGKISDKRWQNQIIKFIKHAGIPVIPVYFHGNNSFAFHLLGSFHPILRTIQLPGELFNKGDKVIKVRIGKAIQAEDIARFDKTDQLSRYLRAKTYALGSSFKVKNFFNQNRPAKKASKVQEIVEPMPQISIEEEINLISDKYQLFQYNEFKIIFSPSFEIPVLINEIGRLREITFREIGEGTNQSIDLDEFDIYYHHLVVWDSINKKIVGAYRIGKGKDIIAQFGKNGFYLSTLFKIKKGFIPVMKQSLEMGRSFITKEYQRKPLSLLLLWKGIFQVLLKNPEYRYLIGPVSISNYFSKFSKSVIVNFIKSNFFDAELAKNIKPRNKFKIAKDKNIDMQALSKEIQTSFNKLDDFINDMQPTFKTPVLLKKYIGLNAKIVGFNIDPDFNDCLDGLIILDIYQVPEDKLRSLSKELEDESLLNRFRNEI